MFQRLIGLFSYKPFVEERKKQIQEDEITSIKQSRATQEEIIAFKTYQIEEREGDWDYNNLNNQIHTINDYSNYVVKTKRKKNRDVEIILTNIEFKNEILLTTLKDEEVSLYPFYRFAMSLCQQYIAFLINTKFIYRYEVKIFKRIKNHFELIKRDHVSCSLDPDIVFSPDGGLFVINGKGFIEKMDFNGSKFCKLKKFGEDNNYCIDIGCIRSCCFDTDGALVAIGPTNIIYRYYFLSVNNFIKQQGLMEIFKYFNNITPCLAVPLRTLISDYIGSDFLFQTQQSHKKIESETRSVTNRSCA